jgi:hypothetical protein
MFGHDWEKGTAKVIDRKMIATADASTTDKPKFGYIVDVQTPTGEVFRGEVQDPHFPPDSYVNAQVGDEVAVLVDYKALDGQARQGRPCSPQGPTRARARR